MILDTNAISALQARDAGLLALLSDEADLVLNVISLGEYRYGIDGSRYRKELSAWLEALLKRSTILVPEVATLPYYSRIRHQLKEAATPIPANDVWIAALALQHREAVLSRDAHFDRVPDLRRISW